MLVVQASIHHGRRRMGAHRGQTQQRGGCIDSWITPTGGAAWDWRGSRGLKYLLLDLGPKLINRYPWLLPPLPVCKSNRLIVCYRAHPSSKHAACTPKATRPRPCPVRPSGLGPLLVSSLPILLLFLSLSANRPRLGRVSHHATQISDEANAASGPRTPLTDHPVLGPTTQRRPRNHTIN